MHSGEGQKVQAVLLLIKRSSTHLPRLLGNSGNSGLGIQVGSLFGDPQGILCCWWKGPHIRFRKMDSLINHCDGIVENHFLQPLEDRTQQTLEEVAG